MKRLLAPIYNKFKSYYQRCFPRLEMLHLESTNFCNLDCRCCHRKQDIVRKKQHLDPILAKKIIDEASQMGVRSIHFHMWGEPLMNKDLEQMISYAVSKGIPYVMFTSNGALLTPERSRSLINAGLHQLTISVIGNSAANYEHLMQGSNYSQVSQNMEDFLSIRNSLKKTKPLLKIQTILMDSTANELKAFVNYWEKRADTVQVNYVSQPTTLSEIFSREFTEFKRSINRNRTIVCQTPFNTMTILSDGSVVSSCCADMNGKCVLGNLAKDSIKKIWHSEQYKNIRKKIRDRRYNQLPVCNECESVFKDILEFQESKMKAFRKNVLDV